MADANEPLPIAHEVQIEVKQNQLSILPAAVVLTCLVGSTIGFLAILMAMFKLSYEMTYLGFMLLIFLVYHIYDADAKARQPYNEHGAVIVSQVQSDYGTPESTHFGLDLLTWKKLETMMVVYGILMLITHCMCLQERLSEELFQGFWFILLLFMFEAETKGSHEDTEGAEFHNSVFIPILFALLAFTIKLMVKCPDAIPSEIIYKDLGWSFVLWICTIVFYSIESVFLDDPNQIIRPFHHFFALLLVLASIFTLNAVESAKAKAKKKERQRERQREREETLARRAGARSPPRTPNLSPRGPPSALGEGNAITGTSATEMTALGNGNGMSLSRRSVNANSTSPAISNDPSPPGTGPGIPSPAALPPPVSRNFNSRVIESAATQSMVLSGRNTTASAKVMPIASKSSSENTDESFPTDQQFIAPMEASRPSAAMSIAQENLGGSRMSTGSSTMGQSGYAMVGTGVAGSQHSRTTPTAIATNKMASSSDFHLVARESRAAGGNNNLIAPTETSLMDSAGSDMIGEGNELQDENSAALQNQGGKSPALRTIQEGDQRRMSTEEETRLETLFGTSNIPNPKQMAMSGGAKKAGGDTGAMSTNGTNGQNLSNSGGGAPAVSLMDDIPAAPASLMDDIDDTSANIPALGDVEDPALMDIPLDEPRTSSRNSSKNKESGGTRKKKSSRKK